MSGVVITAWHALAMDQPVGVAHLYPEPLPATTGHALPAFDVRARLGRKGTGSLDRATALGVACCRAVLDGLHWELDDTRRGQVGVALGTSLGSFKSTSDYTRETLVQDKPYLVNPLLFPNTVMNCAAGRAAIWFGLRGVNATIAGGALAFLNTARYAGNVLARGYADVMLTGAVEEFTPHRAWAAHLAAARSGAPPAPAGEAAAVFVLSRPEVPGWISNRPVGGIRAVALGYGPGGGGRTEAALRGCVSRALRQARVDPLEVTAVITGERHPGDLSELLPVSQALGHYPGRMLVKARYGECDAATGAMALAAFLGGAPELDGAQLALVTGRSPDGAVGAAIVERYADASADRG